METEARLRIRCRKLYSPIVCKATALRFFNHDKTPKCPQKREFILELVRIWKLQVCRIVDDFTDNRAEDIVCQVGHCDF